MSVIIETTIGDLTVDLFVAERPLATRNFLKLCKIKYYNFNLFHTIERGFIAQTGDPTGSRDGGSSIYGVIDGPERRFFPGEKTPKIKHTRQGLLSFVANSEGMITSQFFITLGDELTFLDDKHCVFGEVMEGLDVLEMLNETICDTSNRPYKDIRITHMVVLEDPFDDLEKMVVPERSPSPSAERLRGGQIAPDEDINDTDGKTSTEVNEMLAEKEAKARATILEMVGDIPEADMAPPENVLFVCKLNPVTTDDDLEIIFGRFGKIVSCEVIRDKKSGDSLQYAFVEFDNPKSCEDAYFKMDNVLIDDRRIHVDFSQSVAKVKWNGKGRGVTTFDEHGRQTKNKRNADLGKGIYKRQEPKRRDGGGTPPPRKKSPAERRKRTSEKRRNQTPDKRRKAEKYERKNDARKERRNRSRSRSRSHNRNRNRSRSRDKRAASKPRHYRREEERRRRRTRTRSNSRRRHSRQDRRDRDASDRRRDRRSPRKSSPKRKDSASTSKRRRSSERSSDYSRHERRADRFSRRN